MKTNMRGFTLIEMLMALAVLSVLTFLLVPSMYHIVKRQEINQFFQVLERDIFYIQNRSLGTSDNERIIFRTSDYVIVNHEHKIIARRIYPDHLKNVTQSNARIQFNNKGTILNPTTYRFESENTTYELTFPLGKGRHYLERK